MDMRDSRANCQKNLIVRAYNESADKYVARSTMQTQSLRNLFHYINDYSVPVDGKILDVGCGVGSMAASLGRNATQQTLYVGLDSSIEMLKHAQAKIDKNGLLVLGDAESLPFLDSTFDLVLSNSVFHWLNVPEFGASPSLAWQEAFRVLRPGGHLAFSAAGRGTARTFQRCYQTVARRFEGNPCFNISLFRNDPIGSMSASYVSHSLQEFGFRRVHVALRPEPVIYVDSREYIQEVEGYGGYEIYMAPFSSELQPQVWNALIELFAQEVKNHYQHEQYMIYAVARRPTEQTLSDPISDDKASP